MNPRTASCTALFILTSWLAPILTTASWFSLHAQDSCRTQLRQAEKNYQEGQMDRAIELLTGCLEKGGLAPEVSEPVRKLLAKSYLAKGLPDKARAVLTGLLQLHPDWKPDPDLDAPAFQQLANEVIAEIAREKEGRRQGQEKPASPGALRIRRHKVDVGVSAGLSWPLGPTVGYTDSYATGYNLGVEAGLHVFSRLSVGVGVTFHAFDNNEAGIEGGNFNQLQVLEEARFYLLPTSSALQPYLVGGAGIALTRITDRFSASDSSEGTAGNDLVLMAGLGMRFTIGAGIAVFIEAPFTHVLIDNSAINDEQITFVPLKVVVVF